MKTISIVFLQTVIVFIGIATLAILILAPLNEGRAANLDLFSIYFDKFILFVYATSIAFFIALYKVFRLLGLIRQNELYSSEAIRAVKNIKYCAIVLSILIVIAGLYVRIFHSKEDDPAGFLAICAVITFVSAIIAAASATFEKKLQKRVDIS
ncbi:MAG: DUF2975 domain-containing protein [Dysgonomonas sp.]